MYLQIGPGLILCDFHSLLHLLLVLAVGVSFVGGFLFQQVSWCSQLPPTLFCDQLEWKAKWFKTAGVYSMIFKASAHREDIGDSLHMYSVNCDMSPT